MTQIDRETWIKPQALIGARKALGLSQGDAAKLLRLGKSVLGAWEDGRDAPDDEALWELSSLYGRPISYFFQEPSTLPAHQDFRAQQRETLESEANFRRAIVAEFEELCSARAHLEQRLRRLRSPQYLEISRELRGLTNAKELATFVRMRVGLKKGPIANIREVIEGIGIAVFVLPLPDGSVSGSSWNHKEYGPAMLISQRENEARRNFTMAHELAHLLMNENQTFCEFLTMEVDEERFANRFAAALLMNEDEMRHYVEPLLLSEELGGWGTTDAVVDKIARRYKTSREATSWRLEELGMLPSGFTEAKRDDWSRRRIYGRRKGSRWRNNVRQLGGQFTSMARDAYADGQLSLSALAHLLRISPEHADIWLREPDEAQ